MKCDLVLNNIFTGICILKEDYSVVIWNHLMENISRISSTEIIGKNIGDHCPKFKSESITLRLDMVLDGGAPIVFSSIMHKNLYNNEELFLETIASPITMDDGSKAILLTVKDVTELNLQIIKYRNMKDKALAEVDIRKAIESKLIETNSNLTLMANTDLLTKLYNRRFVIDKIEEELERTKRFGGNMSIVLADIDFFKNINDSYGHDCGDYVLKELSAVLQDNIRTIDTLARWGGEEFLFLLPETDTTQSVMLANKLRKTIQNMNLKYNEQPINITMTFGISAYDDSCITMDDIIKNADIALYNGKNDGRDCIKVG